MTVRFGRDQRSATVRVGRAVARPSPPNEEFSDAQKDDVAAAVLGIVAFGALSEGGSNPARAADPVPAADASADGPGGADPNESGVTETADLPEAPEAPEAAEELPDPEDTGAVDPTEAEPADPTDPEPADPTDTEPADPTDPEPADPTDTEPADPTDAETADVNEGGVIETADLPEAPEAADVPEEVTDPEHLEIDDPMSAELAAMPEAVSSSGQVVSSGGSAPAAAAGTAAGRDSSLPTTGSDATTLALIGVMTIAVGGAMYRVSVRRHD